MKTGFSLVYSSISGTGRAATFGFLILSVLHARSQAIDFGPVPLGTQASDHFGTFSNNSFTTNSYSLQAPASPFSFVSGSLTGIVEPGDSAILGFGFLAPTFVTLDRSTSYGPDQLVTQSLELVTVYDIYNPLLRSHLDRLHSWNAL